MRSGAGAAASAMDLPDVVRRRALACGAEAWLERLPALVAELERAWGFALGRIYQTGTEALVADAALANGEAAVLKLLVPGEGDAVSHEITVLRLADGRGCARLLRSDPARGALLLERLGPPLCELGLPVDQRDEILCATVARLWRPAPGCGLPTGADKGRWLAAWIASGWEELGRPCSERARDHALRCAERRIAAHDDARAVLVHGDVHQWNALQAGDGFKLVDPDGLLAEGEYGLGVVRRADPTDRRGGRRS